MISADCDLVRENLDAFVDGELRGAELRYVADHIDTCHRCADEVASRQALGGLIRESVADGYLRPIPGGLAAGVVARTRAESYFSWRAAFGRAVEDWHWILVGGGAVAATFVSMLACFALLFMGTSAPDADSLSSLGKSLRNSPGRMYAEVFSPGGDRDTVLVQLGAEDGSEMPVGLILSRTDEERQLVDELGKLLIRGGVFVQLASMPEADRRHAERLRDRLAQLRGKEPGLGPMGSLTVYRLHLVTNTEVTASGLFEP